MTFADSILVRLADPATRAGVFDETALEQIATAAYDTVDMPLEAPFRADFSELRLGLALPRTGLVEGAWAPVGSVARVDARLNVYGLGAEPPLRVDAFWRGSIVARTVPPTGRIVEVGTTIPALDTIDAQIVTELGALPADPDDLEAARRARLLERLREGIDPPEAIGETAVNALLARAGAGSVTELLEMGSGAPQPISVRVQYELLAAGPPVPRSLPLTAALLIRDAASFSLAQLLSESHLAREGVASLGLEALPDSQFRPRRSVVVLWVLQGEIFDDEAWPGAAGGSAAARRAARRAAAGVWLAREGIGLAVPP